MIRPLKMTLVSGFSLLLVLYFMSDEKQVRIEQRCGYKFVC